MDYKKRLAELERNSPSVVKVLYPDGSTKTVNALAAFGIAAQDASVSFSVNSRPTICSKPSIMLPTDDTFMYINEMRLFGNAVL